MRNIKHRIWLVLFVVLSVFLTAIDGDFASALNISQGALEIVDKSSTTVVNDAGIGDLSITPNIEFNRINDYISYRLVIKNNDGRKYQIVSINDNNENEAIELLYSYSTDMNIGDKEINFTIKYVKASDSPLNDINVIIKIVDEDDEAEEIPVVIPNTGSSLSSDVVSVTVSRSVIIYAVFAVICCVMYIFVRRKMGRKNYKTLKLTLAFILSAGIIPVAAIAASLEDVYFEINLTEVKLNGPYTVTFDTGDSDDIVPPQIINNGETASMPSSNPGRKGYDFAGWVDENGNLYDFDTPVTGPLTIFAKWQAIIYSIDYELDGGSVTPANPLSYTIETDTFVLNNPTKEHYDFVGWTGSNSSVPETEVSVAKGTTGDLTYSANWKKKVYTVSFIRDYNQTVISTQEVEYGNPATRPADPMAPKFYYFDGWQDADGNEYDFSTPITSDTSIYAIFKRITFTVTFDTDGGMPVPPAQTVEIEGKPTRPADPTKENYIFVGWKDIEQDYMVDFDNYYWHVTSNITLTAIWQPEVAKIVPTEVGGDNTLNLKMKQIANPGETITKGYDYPDTVTRSFKKATVEEYGAVKDSLTSDNIISSSDSLAPVYMWFDNSTGSMYWYTEAAKVEFSGSMGRLFAKFSALTNIDSFADFDTSNVTDMNRVFQNCKSLRDTVNASGEVTKSVLAPLANWDVTNVKSFVFAFGAGADGDAPKITDFSPISGWNVGNCEDFNQMFKYNRYMKNLNAFENWDMTSATNIKNMFTGTTALEDASAIKGWNVVNVITASSVNGFNNVFSGSKILELFADTTLVQPYEKLPPFEKRPGAWNSSGKYIPNS